MLIRPCRLKNEKKICINTSSERYINTLKFHLKTYFMSTYRVWTVGITIAMLDVVLVKGFASIQNVLAVPVALYSV